MSKSEEMHAVVEIFRLEIGAALFRRWTAGKILLEDDAKVVAAAAVTALAEVMLEITSLSCDSLEELKAKRATLAVFLAHLGSSTQHGDGYLRALYDRARKQARG